ncbi:uncharacterized protein LOC108115590 [Drosophila eugracilis]|uniref:uncharacterized protein LOC108115590 n=1 Tax=Drosophila eugracilis TaxID=29029 RepID=UPI0007E852D1|nr:uncharacterized protein LOC108115590 [Drosophila eugracilis]
MMESEEQLQLELDRISGATREVTNFVDLMELSNNSERLIASVNSSLEALNSALDHLEERTENVLVELRRLIGTELRVQSSHDGCGDPDARV